MFSDCVGSVSREFISFLCYRQFRTAQDVLNGARHVVAMQIANDPIVRECVRQTFRERAKITCSATKKGLKVTIIQLYSF